MSELLRAKPLADQIKSDVAAAVSDWLSRGVTPRMAVVSASDDPASISYVQSKQRVAASLGIALDVCDLGVNVTQSVLEKTVADLSANPDVHGVILELPLAPGLDAEAALSLINPLKDIDGLTPANLGLAAAGWEERAILAATPQACIELAEMFVKLDGLQVGVVGRGRTVGRPLVSLLINRHATVTLCHTHTPNLTEALRPCSVVFVAVGQPGAIRGENLQVGQTVIDAGINYVGDNLVGDVDFTSVSEKVVALSPVPGGVGTLTSAIVFRNLMRAIELQRVDYNV